MGNPKKKVLFYIDCMALGGANRVMANLVESFDKKGYSTILINDKKIDSDMLEYHVPCTTVRYYLKNLNSKLGKNISRVRELRTIIKKEKPDTVLSFMGPPNFRLLTASIGLNTRKIISVRNDPYFEYGSGVHRVIANMMFLLADGCVFQTEDARKYFVKSIRKKSRVIYNPVNEKFFNEKRDKIDKEIVIVGRLQGQKNPMLAVKAFSLIADEFLDYKLVFYGDGDLRTDIEKCKQDYHLNDRIIVYGQADDIEKKLASASVYVLCSDFEGMPNALMEAMAMGVPAISTDCPCGGPRMLIENEKQGVLVPCRDENAIAQALRDILKSEELQRDMSVAERKRAEDFRTDRIMSEWEKYLAGEGYAENKTKKISR